ncbi:hypothetical protein MMC11_000873 [Xylographa trunciseda]|nr:hypothetical protein [Xylographa trunciseda]
MQTRELRAASLNSDIKRRGLDVPLYNDFSLHYMEDESSTGSIPLSAHVHLGSTRPVFVLEEIDHLLESVECTLDSIIITFNSHRDMQVAWETLLPHSTFVLITSHWSCNDDGSRLPFLVREAHYDDEQCTIELSIDSIGWNDGFHSLKMDFGRDGRQQYTPRPHRHLEKRSFLSAVSKKLAAATSTIPSVSLSSIQVSSTTVLTPTTNILFPTLPSTEQPTATSIVQNVGFQLLNTQVLPSNNSVAADVEGLAIPPGLSVTCVNCTTAGSLELLTGSFVLGSNNATSNGTDDIVRFIEDGYVSLTATNLFAHIELSTTWLAAQVGHTFTINLATIPLQPFSIPDIAVLGPLFNPRLLIAVDAGMDLTFNYGFEITVPNNSTAVASIGNITTSSITGFQDTKVSMLPFQATVGNLALNLSATLQPEVLVGISFLNGMGGNAGAGVFLELPQLAMEIAPAMGTNEKCEPITNVSLVNDVLGLFGKLTHLVPDVELAGGFVAQATLGPHGLLGGAHQTAYTPLATTFALPTACLAFDAHKSTYVPVSELAATTTTKSAAASTTSVGAASMVRNPFTKKGSGFFGMQAVVVMLGVPVAAYWTS